MTVHCCLPVFSIHFVFAFLQGMFAEQNMEGMERIGATQTALQV